MRILLVTPRNRSSFWTFDYAIALLKKRCMALNLSMPTVAGMTPREHEVVLCDENVEDIDFDAAADIVGVTGYIAHKERIHAIVDEFRRRGKFVVVGGSYASLCPENLRGRCDALFIGESEETWPQFLEDFAAGRPRAEYKAQEKPDMSLSPMPRFDLLKVDQYQAMTVQFSRGCPYRCEFCDIIVVYGRRPRTKGIEQVMDEVRECHRLGARQICLADDNFIANKAEAKKLLRALAEWGAETGYPISFYSELSVNVAQDDEMLELMRQANMTTVFLGIESPRKASLEETKKTQNMRGDLLEQVYKIQSYGLQVQAGMIVGFDNDDPSIFEEHLRFAQEARIPYMITHMLQAIPQTPLYERVRAEGRLIAETEGHGQELGFSNIEPLRMTSLELHRGYKKLIHELFSVENYGERMRGFLLNRGTQINRGTNLRLEDFRLLGRFLVAIAKEPASRRNLVLRTFVEILWKRPQAFKEAGSYLLVYLSLVRFIDDLNSRLDLTIEELEKQASAA